MDELINNLSEQGRNQTINMSVNMVDVLEPEDTVDEQVREDQVNDQVDDTVNNDDYKLYKKWTSANEHRHYINTHKKLKFKTPDEYFKWAKNQSKICSKCNTSQSLVDFDGNTSGSDPFGQNHDGHGCIRLIRPECTDCKKKGATGIKNAKQHAKKMGIDYKAPVGTLCEICNNPGRKGNDIVFDHCHEKEIFRGRVCNSCNRSIGVLGDNVEGMIKVINYLNKLEKKTIVQDHISGDIKVLSTS